MSAPESIGETDEEATGLPAFPSWRGVYMFVAVFFAVMVILMILLQRAFA